MKVRLCLVAQSCPALCHPMDCSPPGTSVHEDSPGKNTGVGSLSLLQRNLPDPGIKRGLLHRRQILHQLGNQGSSSGQHIHFPCPPKPEKQTYFNQSVSAARSGIDYFAHHCIGNSAWHAIDNQLTGVGFRSTFNCGGKEVEA